VVVCKRDGDVYVWADVLPFLFLLEAAVGS